MVTRVMEIRDRPRAAITVHGQRLRYRGMREREWLTPWNNAFSSPTAVLARCGQRVAARRGVWNVMRDMNLGSDKLVESTTATLTGDGDRASIWTHPNRQT